MKNGMRSILLLVLACICAASAIFPFLSSLSSLPKEVRVERVIDGDTFVADGKRFRLLGIDAPERGQRCYGEAKNFLKKRIEGRKVSLEYDRKKRDSYGRYLVYVWLNGSLINRELIARGYAVYRNYGERLKHEGELSMPASGCVASIDTCEECIGVSYFRWNAPGNDCEGGEFVKLKNFCDFPCNLTGWKICNLANECFELKNARIEKTLYIYSGCGENKDNEIYLCPERKCKAIWNNKGERFELLTPGNKVVLSVSTAE